MATTHTFTYTGAKEQLSLPNNVARIEVELWGAGGGSGEGGSSGGRGGYAGATIDSSDLESYTLDIWVGEGGDDGPGSDDTGGWGRYIGGSGGTARSAGGDSGGSTEIVAGSQFLAAADAGGGGGGDGGTYDDGSGGGGGARGGSGASGYSNGTDGGGSGFGGNGGSGGRSGNNSGDPGGDGGAELASVATATTTTTGGGNNSNGEVVVTVYTLPATPTSLTVDNTSTAQIDLSWVWDGDTADNDVTRIYRADGQTPDTSGTPYATLSATATSFSDTSLTEGTEYHYIISGYNSNGESYSSEVQTTTSLPAPSSFVAATVDDNSLEYTWTLDSTNEDGVRVYHKPSSDSSYTQIADLAAGTTSYTDTGLLDGCSYDAYVEAYTTAAASSSSTASATTDLPDVDSFELDASVQDQLTVVAISPAIDNGNYHIRWRRSEASSYDAANEATVPYDAAEYVISGLLDGEKYDVGVRSETSDVTGTWHTASEITKLVATDEITFSNVTMMSFDISWTVNSNFDGSQQIWLERTDYDYGEDPGELIATVSSTATSYSIADLHPEREYRVTVRATTQYVHADGSETASTQSAGLAQQPAGSRGWYVEIDHPSGTTLTPRILDDPVRRPKLNEQTRIDIPVPRNERWLSADLEGAPVRAWKDGQRLPIDKLAEDPVEISADRAVLHAIGGEELDKRITADVTVEPAPDLVRRLIRDNTGLVANVDDVEESVQETDMQVTETQTDWESVTQMTNLERVPFAIQNGDFTTQDACFPRDSISDNTAENVGFDNNDRYNNGQAAYFSSGGYYVEFSITPSYTIPADQVGIKVRDGTIDGSASGTTRYLWDGTAIAEVSADLIFNWTELGSDSYTGGPGGYQAEVGQDLQAGQTYTFRVESSGTSGDVVDAIAVYDQRYTFNWPNPDAATNAGGYLDAPQPKPIATIDLDEAESIFSVIGGDLTAEFDDVSGSQQVGIRNASGASYQTASNTETVSHDWADPGAMVQAQLTLGRYGERNAFPATGFEGQTVSSYTLSVTLDDTPLVIDQTYNNDLAEVLGDIAEDTNSIWEVSWDDAAGSMAIEWTRPGQRTSDQDLEVVNYTTRKVAPNIQRAIIKGGAQPVREEAFTANVGTAVDLGAPIDADDAVLVPGSDRVVDVNGNVYSRGSDYELDRNNLTITVLADGTIPDGTDCLIDYEFKVVGSFSTGHFDGDPREEHVETIPQLTSERGCSQAAKVIVDKGSEARTEADVSLPPSIPVNLSLVKQLRIEDVPGDAMAIYELQDSPRGLQLRLGDRARVDDTVRRIQSQLRSNSERV